MFAIAVPSTITLSTPSGDDKEPETFATLEFFHPTDDVSKCRLRLTTADGDVHEATFAVNGEAVDRYYASAQDLEKQREAQVKEDEAFGISRQREQDNAAAQNERELKTADDTTAADKAWDATPAPPQPAAPRYDPQTGQRNPFSPPPAEPIHG